MLIKKNVTISRNGKQVEDVPFLMPFRDKIKDRYMMLFDDQLSMIAKDKELAGRHFRIMLNLISLSNYENFITQNITEQAALMGMDKRNYTRALNLLIKKEIIIKCGKWRNTYVYKVNSNLAWRGQAYPLTQEREKTIKEIQEEDLSTMIEKCFKR